MPETKVAGPVPSMLATWRWGNLASVAASAVNNFRIDTGDNVHGIALRFAGAGGVLTRAQLITDVATIRMWLNGELVYDRTATEALDEHLFYFTKNTALAAPLGCILVNCMNWNLPIWDQHRGAALGMLKSNGVPGQGPYNTLTMEVTMTAGVATATSCQVHVITDLYPQEPTGLHIRRLRTTRDLGGTTDNFVNDLPRGALGLLGVRITDTNPVRWDVIADNRYVYRDLSVDVHNNLMQMAGMASQVATYSDLRFDLGDDLHSYLPIRDLSKLIINVIAGGVAPGAGTVIQTEEVWDYVRE
ncbi:MAG: hypothetical protein MUC88_20420 [Planctomycetes bacterium]|nr:hypothetical protein [Planctomycetota bacterium]